MSITLICTCGQKLRAKDEQAGKAFPCPKCGANLSVPPSISDNENLTDVPNFLAAKGIVPANNKLNHSMLPLYIMSGLALTLSVIALCWTFFSDPLGSGVSAYDFSTPDKSLKSQLEIRSSQDFRAMLELQHLRSGKSGKEKLETIKVHKTSNYEGKKILFVSFEDNGISKYDVVSFEKDADTGFWFKAYILTYSMSDSDLEAAIKDWKAKSNKVKPVDE